MQNANGEAPEKPTEHREGNGGSNKDLVLALTDNDWYTAGELAEKTGLTVKAVRGVLNAKELKNRLKKAVGLSGKEYHTGNQREGDRGGGGSG